MRPPISSVKTRRFSCSGLAGLSACCITTSLDCAKADGAAEAARRMAKARQSIRCMCIGAELYESGLKADSFLVVILQPQVRDHLFALEMAQRVLQLHGLDEQVMLGIQSGRRHRRFEVEAQPLLDADTAQLRRTLCQVEEEHQIEHDGRSQDGIAAQEIDLDLHRIAEPSEDIDAVPTLFV